MPSMVRRYLAEPSRGEAFPLVLKPLGVIWLAARSPMEAMLSITLHESRLRDSAIRSKLPEHKETQLTAIPDPLRGAPSERARPVHNPTGKSRGAQSRRILHRQPPPFVPLSPSSVGNTERRCSIGPLRQNSTARRRRRDKARLTEPPSSPDTV